MREFAAERYGSFPKVLAEGKQASWYPGGRADQALELSAEIQKVRRLGLYPIVTLEKQLPNMIGNLV